MSNKNNSKSSSRNKLIKESKSSSKLPLKDKQKEETDLNLKLEEFLKEDDEISSDRPKNKRGNNAVLKYYNDKGEMDNLYQEAYEHNYDDYMIEYDENDHKGMGGNK